MNTNGNDQPERRRLSLLQTFKTVGWGFFGVRKGKDHAKDIENLNPVHLIIMGLVMTVIFVVGLIFVAQWFVANLT